MHQTPANNKLSRKYIVSRLHLAQAVLHHNLHPPLFLSYLEDVEGQRVKGGRVPVLRQTSVCANSLV